MKKTKILSIAVALVMLVSAFATLGGIEAFAVSVAKPSITLSNASATSVKVSWKKATNAKKYTVYKSAKKSSGFKAVKTTTATAYTATGLTCGKTYYFKVKAINGSSSSTSAVKSIVAKPSQVKSVKAEKACSFIKLSWAKASGVTGYEVYSASSKTGSFSKISSVTANSYKNTGLKLGATKHYKVRAYKTVSGKKIYGAYSEIVGGKTAHSPASSWIITKKATCKTTGTRTNTCKYCNKKITETIPKNDDHSYVRTMELATEKTCPYAKYTCSNCGDIYCTEAKNHKFSSEIIAPTCTQKGFTTYTCKNCDYSFEADEKDVLQHNYTSVVTDPTCTKQGFTTYTCSDCESVLVDDYIDALGHSLNTNVIDPTCTAQGRTERNCNRCEYSDSIDFVDALGHNYVLSENVAPTDALAGHKKYDCSRCESTYTDDIPALGHDYKTTVVAPTCTEKGYTIYECNTCSDSYQSDTVSELGHDLSWKDVSATCMEGSYKIQFCNRCELYDGSATKTSTGEPIDHTYADTFVETEEGYRKHFCTMCNEAYNIDYTCYIDLTEKTISISKAANFNETFDKLDLTPDNNTKTFEITGSAENLTIDVNADRNIEIKLNGVSIENEEKDCFDIKNKSTETKVDSEGATVPVVPTVAISAKDGTTNSLIATTSGNGIESSCNLELKGHGELDIDTVSTSINCNGKIEMKNLTLNIKSKNRGIDTNNGIKDAQGKYTDFSNITIKPNANITIESTDDGIRCKNMDITVLEDGDVASVISIRAGSDGIQLEGKKGITVDSGVIKITAGKYAFNCKSTLVFFNNGVDKSNCKGASGFAKI